MRWSISIVSHAQTDLVKMVLADLAQIRAGAFEVILTHNLPTEPLYSSGYPFQLRQIQNDQPLGFGANHNRAFMTSVGDFFAVLNPDLRLPAVDLNRLLEPFSQPRVGIVAPLVFNPQGSREDSFRRFPTVWRLLKRWYGLGPRFDYSLNSDLLEVDWAAGMFLVFRRGVFESLNGFDEKRFFMYLEDVDICKRSQKLGLKVVVTPAVVVIHDARRSSRRSARHFFWHLKSMLRYLTGI